MSHTDYIPSRDADFDRWLGNLVSYVTARCTGQDPVWTHIPQAALDELSAVYSAWQTAWAAVKGAHTPVETQAKNKARAAAETRARLFVNQYLRFAPVTDMDRAAMGIPNQDTTYTHHEEIETWPTLNLVPAGPRILKGAMKDSGNGRRAIPVHCHGAEVLWGFQEAPPEHETDLHNSYFSTSAAFIWKDLFTEADRGKRLYAVARWEGRRGSKVKGPWGEIVNAIVP
ncbi:MAG: hypothetical protein LBT11_00010 [Treponema sp.]|jgi:hypothetical protein|nr:hypothetical protein [Treponema sp.]